MPMRLYTFFLEFEGGTYISQVSAISPRLAMAEWARSLDTSQIKGTYPGEQERSARSVCSSLGVKEGSHAPIPDPARYQIT